MLLSRGALLPKTARKLTSAFCAVLLISTSITPAMVLVSSSAHADNVHAVCMTPDELINGTAEDLSGLAIGDTAFIKQFNSANLGGANPGFVKVANSNPGAPITFKLTGGLNAFDRKDNSGIPGTVRTAGLDDLKNNSILNGAVLSYAPQGEIKDDVPGFSSIGSGNAGGANSVASGPIALPVLSTVEATNTEAQELIRQRKELASSAVAVAAASEVAATAAPPADLPPPSASTAAKKSTAVDSSPSKTVTAGSSKAKTKGVAEDYEPVPAQQGIVVDESTPSQGAWAQAFVDYERHDNLAPGSGENLERRQTTVGGIAGGDVTYRRFGDDGLETVQFGLLGGGTHISSKFSDFGNVSNARQTQDGGFVGAYGSYHHNQFSVDGFFKTDLLSLKQRSTVKSPVTCGEGQVLVIDDSPDALEKATQQAGSVNEYTYTVGGNAYYRFDLSGGAYLEPVVGFIYSATNYGDGATTLGLDNGQLFRIQGGARLGRTWDDAENRTWSLALLGMLYSDVYINGYTLDGFGLPPGASEVDEGKLRVLGQLEGNVILNNGLSFNGAVNVRGGEDVFGVGGRLGARLEW